MPFLELSTSLSFPKAKLFSPFQSFSSNFSSPVTFSLCSPFHLPLTTSSHHVRLCCGHGRNLFCRHSQVSGTGEFEEMNEFLNESELEAESDMDEIFDVEALEREAKLAVKELSDTLSRELKIGFSSYLF